MLFHRDCRKTHPRAAALAVLLVAAVSARSAPAELVANPAYELVAKFGAGSWATLRLVADDDGLVTTHEATQTLVELTPEKAVIEVVFVRTLLGKTETFPAFRSEIPALIEAEEAVAAKLEWGVAGDPTETVAVAGQAFEARKRVSRTETEGSEIVSTKWLSDDVLTGLVKEERVETGGKPNTFKVELIAFENK